MAKYGLAYEVLTSMNVQRASEKEMLANLELERYTSCYNGRCAATVGVRPALQTVADNLAHADAISPLPHVAYGRFRDPVSRDDTVMLQVLPETDPAHIFGKQALYSQFQDGDALGELHRYSYTGTCVHHITFK